MNYQSRFRRKHAIIILLLLLMTVTQASRTDDVLNIVWLAPYKTVDDGIRATFNASTSLAGLALAVDKVRSENLVAGMRFNVTWLDSDCYAKTSIGTLATVVRDLTNLPDVILGPPCTSAMQPVADLASYLNIPAFGWMSSDHRLDNKTRASTLVRIMPPLSDLVNLDRGPGNLLIAVCGRFKWNRVAMITSEGPMTTAVSDFFKELLREDSDFYLVRHFSNVSQNSTDFAIIRRLALISEEARIVFLVIRESEVRRYMLHAHDMGLTTGEYQFLYVQPFISDDDEVDRIKSQESWKRYDGRDDDARNAYKSLIVVTYSFIIRWKINNVAAAAVTDDVFSGYRNEMPPYAEPDRYSRFLHDAFYLYCLAYNHTSASNLTTSGEDIFRTVSQIRFSGLTGDVHMNNNGDRLPFFLLWDMGPDFTFRIVIQVKYDVLPNGTVFINFTTVNNIYWGNGQTWYEGYVPPDIPVCGFNNERCPRDTSMETILPSVLSTAVVAGIVVSVLVYRWWKQEQRLYRKHWRLEWGDISFVHPGVPRSQGTTGSQNSSTDSSIHSFDRTLREKKKNAGKDKDKDKDKEKHKEKDKDKEKDRERDKEREKDGEYSFSATMSINASSSFNTSSAPSYAESQRHFCKTGYVKGNIVSVRMIRRRSIKMDRRTLEDLNQLNTVRHSNLALFYGACVDPPNACILWEYCHKGSILDIIQNNDIRLDSMFQFSMAMDIITGLQFIHSTELKVHGNLHSSNCLVDNRWTCKLAGFGLRNLLRGEQPLDTQDDNTRYGKLFWTAPENLRRVLRGERRQYTQTADIYSLAIVLKEILCKNTPYEEELHMLTMTPRDIVVRVAQADGESYFRPMIGDLPGEYQSVMNSFVRLIQGCWAEEPSLRPTSRRVLRLMKRLNPFQTTGIMDNMLKMMEKYSSRLEDVVAERTAQLAEEKRKTDTLLYRMLPKKVADDLKSGMHVQAELFPSVTVYFSDIVGFTQIASESTPMQIIELLNLLYTVYDNTIQQFDVYKVETIGDAYMVVSGLPVGNGLRHATIMADMSLSLLRAVLNFTIPHQPTKQLRVRIGLNTGPVVAGVVGNIMPRYCLFGDTVNLASRMESHGLPLKIQMSDITYVSIEDKSLYVITERGEIEVKGKGLMKTYWLEGKVEVDEGPIDVHTRNRNPSMVNLHNFSMEEFFHSSGHHPNVSSSHSDSSHHDKTGRVLSLHGAPPHSKGPNDKGSRHAKEKEESSRPGIRVTGEGDGDGGTEPELYEKECSGINILRQFSSKPPKLKMVDEATVLH